jgi:ferredoxin
VVREIGALAVADFFEQLRNHEVDVGVALATGMCGHVHRDIFDADREVRAVVEIEATQEILVGLAVAGVLSDDESRYHLENLADA